MTILFRYILREYSKIFGMCFSGLVTIYLVIDFFEKVRRFLRYESGIVPILTYFALKIPSISFQVAPFAILVATLLTLGLFARSNEITAMRSCGISLLWMTSPFLLFAAGYRFRRRRPLLQSVPSPGTLRCRRAWSSACV